MRAYCVFLELNLSAHLKDYRGKRALMHIQKNLIVLFLILLMLSYRVDALTKEKDKTKPSWIKSCGRMLYQIASQGKTDLFLSGYAWHNRFTYTREQINTFNELSLGYGMGRGLFDNHGNWHGLSAIAFLDSHKNLEPVLGYTFLKMAHFENESGLGIGYSIVATTRPDLYHGRPFPGLLPWVSASHRHASLMATYIPGAKGTGNVMFILGKWTLA